MDIVAVESLSVKYEKVSGIPEEFLVVRQNLLLEYLKSNWQIGIRKRDKSKNYIKV